MSAAPRPYSLPSRMVGTNGSECHSDSGPVGTTSVWPAKQTSGAALPRRAHRLLTCAEVHRLALEAGRGEAPGEHFLATPVFRGD